MESQYNYVIGDEVIFFGVDGNNDSYGKIEEVRESTVLCIMDDNTPIEYKFGDIIPLEQVKDLFDTPELLPIEVQEVLSTFDDDADAYRELERLLDELRPLGYSFSYYLDADPYYLRKTHSL